MPAKYDDLKFRARFWSNVNVTPDPDECWEWIPVRKSKSYVSLVYRGKGTYAHRLAFFFTHGHWTVNNTLHRCDNRKCCNPNHLWDGTQKENIQDCWNKDRANFQQHPERRGYESVVTKAEAVAIRERYEAGETRKSIRKDFPHLTKSRIYDVTECRIHATV